MQMSLFITQLQEKPGIWYRLNKVTKEGRCQERGKKLDKKEHHETTDVVQDVFNSRM